MSQRNSGYAREDRDLYITPSWVVKALLPHIPSSGDIRTIWEPACGNGAICQAIKEEWPGMEVTGTDIEPGDLDYCSRTVDFLNDDWRPYPYQAIITNPPYSLAQKFMETALQASAIVAMLLRVDFDSAKSRRHLFANNKRWYKKVVLVDRIRWFESETGNNPSFNHAWYIFDSCGTDAPTIAYAGKGK